MTKVGPRAIRAGSFTVNGCFLKIFSFNAYTVGTKCKKRQKLPLKNAANFSFAERAVDIFCG